MITLLQRAQGVRCRVGSLGGYASRSRGCRRDLHRGAQVSADSALWLDRVGREQTVPAKKALTVATVMHGQA